LLFYTVRYDALVTTKYFIKKSTEYLIPIYPITNDTHSTKKKSSKLQRYVGKKSVSFFVGTKKQGILSPEASCFPFSLINPID